MKFKASYKRFLLILALVASFNLEETFAQSVEGANSSLEFIGNLDNNELALVNNSLSDEEGEGLVFSPIVTATCRTGVMTIKVETLNNFVGVVHSRDYRKPECSGYGENSKVTFLRINMLAEKNDRDFCGIFYSQPSSEERSVAVAIRTHKTLELVDDKFYMITCGKAGFQNTRNQTSLVNLRLLRNGKKVEHVVYGRQYTLRADISHPDGQFGMQVKRCFSFSDTNNTVALVDNRGCSDSNIISNFDYDLQTGRADAKIFSMFKFPESHRVHFQCDIIVCRDECPTNGLCDVDFGSGGNKSGRALSDTEEAFLQPPEEGALMASYSVFVLEPGSIAEHEDSYCEGDDADCDVDSLSSSLFPARPAWLLYLCIVFGVLFLLMLIVNIFLCSAMTCSCGGSDEGDTLDKDNNSMIEEFDPYTRSWHGSQYGSRYSLSGGIKPIPPPLISVDTSHSISSSAASDYGGTNNNITITGAGDHGLPAVYGVPPPQVPVHSRPSSRYSNRSHRSRHRQYGGSSSSTTSMQHQQYSKYSNGRMIN